MRAFIRKTKNKGVNMKPIRKNELEHWANLIDRKFESRGEELQRQFETEVDKLTENTFSSFKKKIKADDLLNQFAKDKKNHDEYFQTEVELERLKNISRSKLCNYLEKLSNRNQWDLYNINDCKTVEAFEKQFEEACRSEAKRHLKKQPIAKDINNLEAIKEHAKNILMSGRDINVTVSTLNQLCESKGISLNAPKSLLQLSE
jgi:DNA-binding Xre family transcriptional regulator